MKLYSTAFVLLLVLFSSAFSLAQTSSAPPSCNRYPICPDAPDFELIKPNDTGNPHYPYRDSKYLCFYLATPQLIKDLQYFSPQDAMNVVIERFDSFGGGQVRLAPMPVPSGYEEVQRHLGQVRLYQGCEPVAALVTFKTWKKDQKLIYIDVKHTVDRF